MTTTIILFVVAVVVAILLGISIGRKRGYSKGFFEGSNNANKWWRERLPEDVFKKTFDDALNEIIEMLKP